MNLEASAISHPTATDRLNEYAVVTYVPEPLGLYLDNVRKELAPWMTPGRSHVTVLQPRPISSDVTEVWEDIRESASTFRAFEIGTTSVEVFETTGVIYLGLDHGVSHLERMHRSLNANGAEFPEPFPFHPHITLAQGIAEADYETVLERARSLWRDYAGERSFRADRFHFVQNTAVNLWIDLETIRLDQPSES
jgi:2'-5' RNA ligase